MTDTTNASTRRVGIEITGTSLTTVCLGADGVVLTAKRIERSETLTTDLHNLIDEIKQDFGHFDRIGIAAPGLIESATGRISFSTNLPDHADIDLVSEVQAATGLRAVIENDANAAAYAEFHLGAGRGSRNMFYATLGEGVGGAFIFDGKLWRGSGGFAGEFGYIPINSEGMKLEDVASSSSIIRRTRSRFHQDSTSSLSRLSEEGITIAEIIAAADKEDGFAQMMLERTGTYVGVALATVINLLNIGTIVIGGEIIQTKQLVLDAIVQQAGKYSFKPSFESTRIIEAQLGTNAAAIGAAMLSAENK